MYKALKVEAKNDRIEDIMVHPEYNVVINDELICKFVPDFTFFDKGCGRRRYILLKKNINPIKTSTKIRLFESVNKVTVEYW